MKIYIPTISLSNIKKNLYKFDDFHKEIMNIYEINSLDYGLHILNDSGLYRLEPNFDDNIKLIKNFNNHDILLDMTKDKLIPVLSQMPTKYILTKIQNIEYKANHKTKLKLIIKYIDNKPDNLATSPDKVPVDFYFIYNNENFDLLDIFLQEELNMFLSLLN
jgi:hypothetical protein